MYWSTIDTVQFVYRVGPVEILSRSLQTPIRQLWPQEVNPSVAHQFLKLLEDENKVRCQ